MAQFFINSEEAFYFYLKERNEIEKKLFALTQERANDLDCRQFVYLISKLDKASYNFNFTLKNYIKNKTEGGN